MPLPDPQRPEFGRDEMRAALQTCRAGTLALFRDVDETEFRGQAHGGFSPLGWHLGHIVHVEALFLAKRGGVGPLPRPQFATLFDVGGIKDKAERGKLPPIAEVLAYATEVRDVTLARLKDAEFSAAEEPLWHFVLQHEAQHAEIISFLRQLRNGCAPAPRNGGTATNNESDMVAIPAGSVTVGSDDLDALDNERPTHRRDLADFRISRLPVTQRQFGDFMAAGGYKERRFWSEDGWAWRESEGVARPLYWREGLDQHPVAGVSAYEADAWCRFNGARLPTEFEWEAAASWDPETEQTRRFPWGNTAPSAETCNYDGRAKGTTSAGVLPANTSASGARDMLGNVWEWTSSVFTPYPGFVAYPYEGYSAVYFDDRHRVLRGGSWATRPWSLRASARNWYTPDVRQILAGFRYARDGLSD